MSEAKSILQQVAMSLAVAEQSLQFEHRDLHWGNVLVKRLDAPNSLEYLLNGNAISIDTHGVKAVFIDFTLSRLKKGHTSSVEILKPYRGSGIFFSIFYSRLHAPRMSFQLAWLTV